MSGELKECGVLSKGAVEKIAEHYRHAVKKHPYFCDYLIPFPYSLLDSDDAAKELLALLKSKREDLVDRALHSTVTAESILKCELAEVYDAYANNNTAAAVDECYDCIAVLIRMIDVLEGRQELGKPDSANGGTEK